ncbi:MAG TPA: hypothetical protein VGL93_11125 [Streptosporangiaceae bacterium]|jgi:hypothetical protein
MRQGVHADRRMLRAAVLGAPGGPDAHDATAPAYHVVRGIVADASPYVLALETAAGRTNLTLAPDTGVWRGEDTDSTALRIGDDAVARLPAGSPVPDRIWAAFGRVTGVITAIDGDRTGARLEVDTGPPGVRPLLIPHRYADRIAVRHPRLRPGYLIDVIGAYTDRSGVLHGVRPATSQPPGPGDPGEPAGTGSAARGLVRQGGVTWYETTPGDDAHGLAYPAIDPATEAGAACDSAGRRPYLPYLSIGSEPGVRNDCTGLAARLPVLACAATAPLFNDRCLRCGTSPRGRLAELTPAAFVALGGELDDGCFNATVTVG